MRHALEAGWFGWHVERSAINDWFAGNSFLAVGLAAIVVADAPRWIVRGGCDDANLVPRDASQEDISPVYLPMPVSSGA